MDVRKFFAELKRRHVYKIAGAYAVVAWVLIQIATQVFPFFEVPNWAVRLVVLLLILGFPIALIIAWAFELTPDGIKRADEVTPNESSSRSRGGRLIWMTVALAVIGVALFVAQRWRANPGTKPSAVVSSPAPAVASSPAIPEKSIAVLPFENLSSDKENAYFADGVQDEILTDLARVADLKVISRTSVLQYRTGLPRNLREIGQQLGVAHLLEGSVQRVGGKVRVDAQLIDARTDAHLWAQVYDRPLDDVFAIQSEIAEQIAEQLQAAISPQEHAAIAQPPTKDLKAYDLYLKAEAEYNKVSETTAETHRFLNSAAQLITKATQLDPSFARAFAFMAQIQGILYISDTTTSAQAALVHRLAETVERLRPGSAEAHQALGMYAFAVAKDFRAAHEEFSQAVRLAPNDANSFAGLTETDRIEGFWEDAVAHGRKAAELDPGDALEQLEPLYTLEALHRYREVDSLRNHLMGRYAELRHNLQLDKAFMLIAEKGDFAGARQALAALPSSYDPEGRTTLFRLYCDLCERNPAQAAKDLTACPLEEIAHNPRPTCEAWVARARGDEAGAVRDFTLARPLVEAKIQTRPAEADFLMDLAEVDAGLGRKEEARAEARRGAAMHPLDKDNFQGPRFAGRLALVLTQTGDRAEALDILQNITNRPAGPDYGNLRFSPDWDPLRGEQSFQKLVAALAPKAQ